MITGVVRKASADSVRSCSEHRSGCDLLQTAVRVTVSTVQRAGFFFIVGTVESERRKTDIRTPRRRLSTLAQRQAPWFSRVHLEERRPEMRRPSSSSSSSLRIRRSWVDSRFCHV